MADKFLNDTGLRYYHSRAKLEFASKTALDALDDKVDDIIAEGGEPNVIEIVKRNGVALQVTNKAVDVTVPTTVAELTDASDYAKVEDVPTKVSELTNDGDGTSGSKFATEKYVDDNGGKIDSIKVNGTAQTITNKTVDITVPTKTSDLTNDGDGTDSNSPFATKKYVDDNGGKIDTIKVNGATQTITNKEVNITVPTSSSDLSDGATIAHISDIPTAVSELTNDSNYQTDTDVEDAINAKIGSAYKAKGSTTFANLPALQATNEGNVYNVIDEFTTTSDFVEGAGKTYPAGTNVVIINNGTEQNPVYKYDALTGLEDLSAYWISTSGQTNSLTAMTTADIDAIIAEES